VKAVDETLFVLGERIKETEKEIREQELELKKMFCCWKQYLEENNS
jgi:uncharacterized protein with HEPN domain